MSYGCVCHKCRLYVTNVNPDYGYCESCGKVLESDRDALKAELKFACETLERMLVEKRNIVDDRDLWKQKAERLAGFIRRMHNKALPCIGDCESERILAEFEGKEEK